MISGSADIGPRGSTENSELPRRGEDQRRSLAGHPGDRQQNAGDDARGDRPVGDIPDHERPRHAERRRGFAERVRHQIEHVFRCPHHDRRAEHRE